MDGPGPTPAVRRRRVPIPTMAGRYSRLRAGQVDIYASDRRDVAVIDRVDRRYIDVTLSAARAGGPEHPYFHRRFDTRETSDLRIYLEGGNDYAVVRGDGSGPTQIRLLGGAGDDRLVGSSRAGGVGF